MKSSILGILALVGALLIGVESQAHHAVAGVYDLNKEIVLQGELVEVNIRNPHSNLVLAVASDDGKKTEWVLTTASIQTLARAGINRSSLKAGDSLRIIKEFLLVQSLWACCYGQPPDINGIVRVVMKGDKRVDYQFDPIRVRGTFEVEATLEDGYCIDIFQLHASEVGLIDGR